MIVWINGAYGAGKTTTAEILREKLPNSYLFDPEDIGTGIRNMKPASLWKDDFQDYPSWRETVCCLLRELHETYDGTIIVPMTIVNPAYLEETVLRLEREGLPILHFVLLAGAERILERICRRGEDETYWCARQIDRCVQALGRTVRGIEIDTNDIPPEAAAEEIFAHIKKGGAPCPD
ncbi:MAG: AAA family ATPase [Oscillospiraceae bacterium]|nr:AAA family ATPase [Oscillospiraceae bacterium]